MEILTEKIKTGECLWRDTDGVLWLAESWVDPESQEVSTTQTLVEE